MMFSLCSSVFSGVKDKNNHGEHRGARRKEFFLEAR